MQRPSTPAGVSVSSSRSSSTARQSPTASRVAARVPSAPTMPVAEADRVVVAARDLDPVGTGIQHLADHVVTGGPLRSGAGLDRRRASLEVRDPRHAAHHRLRRAHVARSLRRSREQQRQQRRPLGHPVDDHVLVLGVRSVADRAQPVQGRGEGAGDVPVRGAADERLVDLDLQLGGGLAGELPERAVAWGSLQRRTPEAALDLQRDALGDRLSPRICRSTQAASSASDHPRLDPGHRLGRDHVGAQDRRRSCRR